MPMQMVCPANAASVRGRIARFLRLTRRCQIEPFASSEMGESMDTDLLPELSAKLLGGVHVAGRTDGGLTSGGCRFGIIVAVPSGQDAGDGSGVGPVGQCAIVG